jgi:uncharacterized protein YcaQ
VANGSASPIRISKTTARRFVLGRQGLWPGPRWRGSGGVIPALRAAEAVQLDPLNVVARSQDIAMLGRVLEYQPEQLHEAAYQDRAFFDYGHWLYLYPMKELPFWRLPMRREAETPGQVAFAATHAALLDDLRAEIRARGPVRNRDFAGTMRVTGYRSSKDTGVALFHMWITGELMIHHREGFERVYDLRERVAPPHLDYAAEDEAAEAFFAEKAAAFLGLASDTAWRAGFARFIGRRVDRAEAARRLAELVARGALASVRVEGSPGRWYVPASALPLLAALEAGEVPAEWTPLGPTTAEAVTFLAPLEIVSARGRAGWLFDFDYAWEVYKPVSARRWGYYTLPILYGDRLVARLDPKLDRAMGTLALLGFWLEADAPTGDPTFAEALGRGLVRFAEFLKAQRLDLSAIEPAALRAQVRQVIEASSAIEPFVASN